MSVDELGLVPTQELINELLSRTTFQGVVVHVAGGVKSPHWSGERQFRVSHNANLDTEEAGRLLNAIGHHITSRYPSVE